MPQPPGTPPEQWERRRDDGTRKLVSEVQEELKETRRETGAIRKAVDALEKDVGSMDVGLQLLNEKVLHAVSYRVLMGVLGAVAVVVVTVCWKLTEKSTTASTEAVEKAVARLQKEQGDSNREVREDIRAIYKSARTKKPQERLEKPIEEEEP